MGAAYIRGFVIILRNSATVYLELWVICLKLILNKTKNVTIRIISQDLKTCQKLISIYLNMNVSETIVV